MPSRGVQPFGVSGPHWKKSCLGPCIKYIVTRHHKKKSHNVLSKFTILCWAAVTAVLGCMCPVGHRLDTPALESLLSYIGMLLTLRQLP